MPKQNNNQPALEVTDSSPFKTIPNIINDLQPLLDKDTFLLQVLGGKPFLSFIENHNNQTPVGGLFNLPGYSAADLRVVVLKQIKVKRKLQHKNAELEIIHKFRTMDTPAPRLNRDIEFLSH